jgi:hypothetical protein
MLAIAVLEAPDAESRSREHDGARIVRVSTERTWGWIIVNYAKYRAIRDEESRREQNAEAVRRHRAKKAGKDDKVNQDVIVRNDCNPPSSMVSRCQPEKAHAEAEAEAEAEAPIQEDKKALADTAPAGPVGVGSAGKGKTGDDSDGPADGIPPMTLKNGHLWFASVSVMDALDRAFGRELVDAEMPKAASWTVTHVSQRKTEKFSPKFLHGWMQREENTRQKSQAKPSPAYSAHDGWDKPPEPDYAALMEIVQESKRKQAERDAADPEGAKIRAAQKAKDDAAYDRQVAAWKAAKAAGLDVEAP